MTRSFPSPRTVLTPSIRMFSVLMMTGLLGAPALAVPKPVAVFRAQFDRMDAEGHLLLLVSKTSIPVDLYGNVSSG